MGCVNEVLAPAGGPDALRAAVRCGADAVYLGGRAFNARRNASNFSEEELAEAIRYCHARGVKVYITLNTLVSDAELKTASDEIRCACRLSADALILQDLGLAAIAREIAPDMPLHASTQMSVQSAEGVKLLEEAGFSRVVLARELSLKEIKEISDSTCAQLEVFVHGALCMSVSGQCLLSAVLGSRSGNRGLCAQPCRLPFGVNGEKGHELSLKDLSFIHRLGELSEAGVTSFKIEGRMKRPEYVAAAVTACRQSLDGELSQELSEQLRSVFSRSGFTQGYLDGKLGADMFGTRQKEDVMGAAAVLKKLERLYDKELPKIPVDFDLLCEAGKKLSLTASAGGKTVSVTGDCEPAPALHRSVTPDELRDRVGKCGGTQFIPGEFRLSLGDGLSVPASAVNALRRDALESLGRALGETAPVECGSFNVNIRPHTAGKPGLHIRVFSPAQLPDDLSGIGRVILPLDTAPEIFARIPAGIETAVEIPRAFFSNTEKFRILLNRAKNEGAKLAIASTLDGIQLAREEGFRISAGFGTNIFNTEALRFFTGFGVDDALVSCELTLQQTARLGGEIPRGLLAYGKLPLMLTRNCPVKNKLTCAECGRGSHLTDRMGIDFPVQCSFGCSELLNSRPVYLADRLDELKGADWLLLRFTDESPEEVKRVISAYRGGTPPKGDFTRGLYYRGVE